jgi:hypothetical protein
MIYGKRRWVKKDTESKVASFRDEIGLPLHGSNFAAATLCIFSFGEASCQNDIPSTKV